uniref:Metastriate one of each protein family n=1 Tax=Rhipicephalus zambeziensis TaxID=60191 RepID=A0A224YNT8_9ACAR
MGWSRALALVAFLASSCEAMFYSNDYPCDFTNVTIDEMTFFSLIAKLPEATESGPRGHHRGYRTLLPGIEYAGPASDGLSKLRMFGPAIPYCAKGKRMVQADFISDGDLRFWWPWKTCWGDVGRATIRAQFTRLTFQFRVVGSAASGVKLEFDKARPVFTHGIRFYVEGTELEEWYAVDILSELLPNFVENLWLRTISANLNSGFRFIDS